MRQRVQLLENDFLVDLLTAGDRCVGALIHDRRRRAHDLLAGSTVLATGGAGQLYRVTTNPPVATGDGVAAAWRAGAELRTSSSCSSIPRRSTRRRTRSSLITEALRGEGAYLLDGDGERFMVALIRSRSSRRATW